MVLRTIYDDDDDDLIMHGELSVVGARNRYSDGHDVVSHARTKYIYILMLQGIYDPYHDAAWDI
jgi:hypothetical protein